MKYISRLISDAIAANGESVSLLIEQSGSKYSAALVNVNSDETITLQSDWQIELAAEGDTVQQAIEALEEICAEDYMGVI